MDKRRGGQDRIIKTMGCPGPTMTLLPLCITVLALQSISDASFISPRLPTQIVMSAIIVVKQEPLNLDHLSLIWEYNGRLLVEYKDNHMTSYEPRMSMPQDQFTSGNFSLILNNITMNDAGNYTCLIQYHKKPKIILYALRIEKHRIQLFDLSPKEVDENIDNNEFNIKHIKRISRKIARESRQPTSQKYLNMEGYDRFITKPGGNISLMCKFSTDSSMELTMLTIRWSKDGVTKWIYNKEDRDKLEELSKGYANLNLTSVQRQDGGKYTCNIKYRDLEKNISTIVIVRDNDEEDSASTDRYRKEKIGVVVGVVAVANCLAYFIYFCVAV